jgi:hypothetical protein
VPPMPTESPYDLRPPPPGYRTFRWDTRPGPMWIPPGADIAADPD